MLQNAYYEHNSLIQRKYNWILLNFYFSEIYNLPDVSFTFLYLWQFFKENEKYFS